MLPKLSSSMHGKMLAELFSLPSLRHKGQGR